MVKVYDIIGREITTSVTAVEEAGYHPISFDASNLTSGIYFVNLNTNGNSRISKTLLLK